MKPEFDLVAFIRAFHPWNIEAFGPGERVIGICKHIEKELDEIRAEPKNLDEWIDVIQLALAGAIRQGYSPEAICAALDDKFRRNQERIWPDWRNLPHDSPIEHIKSDLEQQNAAA